MKTMIEYFEEQRKIKDAKQEVRDRELDFKNRNIDENPTTLYIGSMYRIVFDADGFNVYKQDVYQLSLDRKEITELESMIKQWFDWLDFDLRRKSNER